MGIEDKPYLDKFKHLEPESYQKKQVGFNHQSPSSDSSDSSDS